MFIKYKSFKLKNLFPIVIIFLSTFFIYLTHLSSSVYGGDSGDFLSAITVRGVAHPSGYPLYTLFGIIASWLPLHQTLAWKVDLLSALFSSFAVIMIYKIVNELLKSKLLAVIAAFTLAFVFPFWLFAEVSEVFALHNLLILLIFYFALLLYTRKNRRYLYPLLFITGLSFSNHELTFLILPSVLIFIVALWKSLSLSISTIGKCLGLFLVGLVPYTYIFIAASHNPPINWDHASTIENFIRLVTRADYGWQGVHGQINTSLRALAFQEYIAYIFSVPSIGIIAFAFFGIVGMLRKKQYVALFSLLSAFFLFGPFFIFYSGNINLDAFGAGISEKFYPTSYLFLILLVPYGMDYLANFLKRIGLTTQGNTAGRVIENVTLGFFALLPIWIFLSNVSSTNLSTNWIGDTFGKDILTSLPKNSYIVIASPKNIILGSIDDVAFNSRYMQYAYGLRKDVSIPIESDLVNNKPESGNRPVFITVKEFNGLSATEKATEIPYGLLFLEQSKNAKELSEGDYNKIQKPILLGLENSSHTIPSSESLSQLKLIADIPLWYARAFANTGSYLIYKYHDYETAKKYFQISLSIDQDSDIAYEGLGDYAMHKNDCKDAEVAYQNATDIGFLNERFYQKLYTVVDSCLHDETKAQELRDLFSQHPSIFGGIH